MRDSKGDGLRLRAGSWGTSKSPFYLSEINGDKESNSKNDKKGVCQEADVSQEELDEFHSNGQGLSHFNSLVPPVPDQFYGSARHSDYSSSGKPNQRLESFYGPGSNSSIINYEAEFGSLSSLRGTGILTRPPPLQHESEVVLVESPSSDDAELVGMAFDLGPSPIPSPVNNRTSSILSIEEWTKYTQLQIPPPPPASFSSEEFAYDTGSRPSYGSMVSRQHHSSNSDSAFQYSQEFGSHSGASESVDGRRFLLERISSLFGDRFGFVYLYDSFDSGRLPWFLSALLRIALYDKTCPEFSSLQQFNWAVILGLLMGIFTSVWKELIDFCVHVVWKIVPEALFRLGVFTDLSGAFPIYHYMWIAPGIFGGVLSYIFAALPQAVPGQNEWIHSLHCRGVQESDTFGMLFLLSTAGMASGLSLGPELPLILTSGMIGSKVGLYFNQSILSARVMNLTAASAAIGGFFGFPMAGALFVLEVPHRMGLQYFEALTPATIASIVAVLTNRLATGNDVTGYFEYPFLNESLPSSIFHDAIVFGFFGAIVGIVYTRAVLRLKDLVHNLFHDRNTGNEKEHLAKDETHETDSTDEMSYLVGRLATHSSSSIGMDFSSFPRHSEEGSLAWTISNEPTRAALVGAIVGIVVGATCIFFPHVMFWGEEQLQTLIDRGRTPLPVFGREENPSAGLVALGFCMPRDHTGETKIGFGVGCSAAIAIAKVFVTGISLGTGIIGGHFWAPLFVGCASSHLLTDTIGILSKSMDISLSLSNYPCVALLCVMGSVHVVTFRAHIAIILILTLTIDAFNPEDDSGGSFRAAGDYSAVFPLLTVAVFVALQVSRHTIFYETQRSRGDITAIPEVLCEPGKEGQPLVIDYEVTSLDANGEFNDVHNVHANYAFGNEGTFRRGGSGISQSDIEEQFRARTEDFKMEKASSGRRHVASVPLPSSGTTSPVSSSPLPPRPQDRKTVSASSAGTGEMIHQPRDGKFWVRHPTYSVEELVSTPTQQTQTRTAHRRTRSEPFNEKPVANNTWGSERNQGGASIAVKKPVSLIRISSFGQVGDDHPSLLDQARKRAASFASTDGAETPSIVKRSQSTGSRQN